VASCCAIGRNSVEATNALRILAVLARRALLVPLALRRVFPDAPAFAVPPVALLLAAPRFTGFLPVVDFFAAEPPPCPDAVALAAPVPLPELCPPLGTTTINAASVPASHRRNRSA
jgi:hypothetical protein